MANEKFCLRWNDFESNIGVAFRELREDQEFFDVTLACDEDQIQAHKVILSACSPFFRRILQRNPHPHPVLYLKGVKLSNLQSILNFMYHGEVNLAQEDLNVFLEVAEELKVKGLTQKQSSKMPESGVAIQPREQDAPPGPDLNSNTGKSPPTSVPKPKRHPLPHIKDDIVLVKSVPDEEPLYLQPWSGDPETEEKHEIEDLGLYEGGGGYDARHSGGEGERLVYQCEECSKWFSNRSYFRKHKQVHLGMTKCKYCEIIFSSVSALRWHVKKYHTDQHNVN